MDTGIRFTSTPKYVGKWVFGGTYGLVIRQVRKPRWLTRLLCKWLLEWEWRDG